MLDIKWPKAKTLLYCMNKYHTNKHCMRTVDAPSSCFPDCSSWNAVKREVLSSGIDLSSGQPWIWQCETECSFYKKQQQKNVQFL